MTSQGLQMTDLTTSKPLSMEPLVRLEPMHADETLRSYLERLARLNVYESRRSLTSMIPRDVEGYSEHWFQALSYLTKTSAYDLKAAHKREFGPLWTMRIDVRAEDDQTEESTQWGRSRIARHLRNGRNCSYCPLCLKEAAYERSSWVSKYSIYCSKHLLRLADKCPTCESKVYLTALVSDCCAACGSILSAQTSSLCAVESADLASQKLLDVWWDSGDKSALDECNLPSAPNDVLYQLFVGLVEVIAGNSLGTSNPDLLHADGLSSDSTKLSRERTMSSYHVLAFEAISEWPNGFYEFLDLLRRRHGRAFGNFVHQDFQQLYRKYLEDEWLRKEFDFVQEAFEEFLYRHYQYCRGVENTRRYLEDSGFRGRFRFISTKEAARRLGIHHREVEELTSQGVFLYEFPHRVRPGLGRWLHTFAVDYWADESRKQETARSAAEALGIPIACITPLIEVGLLTGKAVPDQPVLVDSQSVLRFQNDYRRAMTKLVGPPIPFHEGLKMLEPYGWNYLRLIQAVLAQEIKGTGGGPGVYATNVDKSDVEKIRTDNLTEEFLMPSAAKTAAIFGVDPSFVLAWHSLGLMPRHDDGKNRLYDMSASEIREFRQKYVFFREAVEILDVPNSTFYHYLTNGIVRYVGHQLRGIKTGLFYRKDIEKLAATRKRYNNTLGDDKNG